MNAALPITAQRPVPQALLDALATRFGGQCSTAQAVREQHGRDEGSIAAPPPAAVVFAESAQDVQDAVRLAFFDGLSHGEIAARTGLPLGTIKGRVRLGLRKLATLLAEPGGPAP